VAAISHEVLIFSDRIEYGFLFIEGHDLGRSLAVSVSTDIHYLNALNAFSNKDMAVAHTSDIKIKKCLTHFISIRQ